MDEEHKETIKKVIDELRAHDPWMWGNTCAKMLNEIDWDGPAIIEREGDYITVRFLLNKREFELSHKFGGYALGYVLPENLRLMQINPKPVT